VQILLKHRCNLEYDSINDKPLKQNYKQLRLGMSGHYVNLNNITLT